MLSNIKTKQSLCYGAVIYLNFSLKHYTIKAIGAQGPMCRGSRVCRRERSPVR